MNTATILALNTKACFLMSANKYRDAGILLVSALRQIQESQNACQAISDILKEPEKELTMQPIRIGKDDHDGSSFSLYNWGLLAMDYNSDASQSNLQSEIKLSAILLYNTGLCYQAMGMAEGTERASFDMALKMYDIALSLISTRTDSDNLLHLALLNNKGYIMAHFYEFDQAQACLAGIKYLLTTMYAPDEIHREDILEIRMNVALLFGQSAHASAA